MIRQNTVLILGAGASQPYEYPLGEGLMELTIQSLHDGEPGARLLGSMGHLSEEIHGFHKALRDSGLSSVDAFLEHRHEYVDMGKLVLAEVLLRYESTARLFEISQRQGNWYKYLWGLLKAGGDFESFGENRLSIITFNYDVSLEQFLIAAMMNSYGEQYGECLDQLRKVPIVHVHGSLGKPGRMKYGEREYGNSATKPRDIQKAANSIKIIHESVKDDPEFQEADRLLSEASIVCFLGFGYNDDNLERLQLRHCIKTEFIAGSSRGRTNAERRETTADISGRWARSGRADQVYMGNTEWDCISFLKGTCVLGKRASFEGTRRHFRGASAQ